MSAHKVKNVIFPIAVGYTLLLPTIAAFMVGWQEATVLAVIGIVVILSTRIEDLKSIKLWGLEAQLRNTIHDAAVTIDQLRSLAGVIAKPAILGLTMQGSVMRQVHFSFKYTMKREMDAALSQIGLSPEQMRSINSPWNQEIGRQFACLVIRGTDDKASSGNANRQFKEEIVEKINNPVPPELVRAFTPTAGLWNEDRAAVWEDYRHFVDTGEIRRPEIWPIGYQP